VYDELPCPTQLKTMMQSITTPFPKIDDLAIREQARQVKMPRPLTTEQRDALRARIKQLLIAQNAVLVAHYYTDDDLQQLADETGGCVSDSLEMARFGHASDASTIVVAGVRFMGETAKILNPEKRVLMPTVEAECSLDLSCPADTFSDFCDAHPNHTVVVYANTSAEVKARADWVVTSSIATRIVKYLAARGEKILWAPDRYLGDYIQKVTGADMLLWQGSCIVHDEFKATKLKTLHAKHPEAAILVHPESPNEIIQLADVVGSTTQIINAATELDNPTFIVATDRGIFYKMKQAAPDKTFLEAPTGGIGASCGSCAHCPWMAMNTLENLALTLETGSNEIHVDPNIGKLATHSLNRMLNFAAQEKQPATGVANIASPA